MKAVKLFGLSNYRGQHVLYGYWQHIDGGLFIQITSSFSGAGI